MKVSATIENKQDENKVILSTNGEAKSIPIPSRSSGFGSAANGGELLMLALATCYCNDIYREAAKRKINVRHITVECHGEFGAEGEPGKNFFYTPVILSDASPEQLAELILHTDRVAEIHNTLRQGIHVTLQV